MDLLYTLGVMIVLAAVLALLAKRFNQPLLLGYVLAGLLLGPAVTGIVQDPMSILSFFAEMGLVLLLFIIGLELDFSTIKSLGKMSVIIGTTQVTLITAVVWGLGLLLGFGTIPSLYCGLVVAFSSTLVVVKLLAEKRELDTEHGSMVLGILIVEDILAVIGLTLLGVLVESGETQHSFPTFMSMIHSLGVSFPHAAWFSVAELFLNGILFVIVALLLAKYVLPKIMEIAASSTELLFATSLMVALVLAGIGAYFAFSLAIGAFVAGIVLSSSSYRHEIMGKTKPVKEFFLVLFFVALGTLLTVNNLGQQLKLIAFLLVTSIILKPIIIFGVRKVFKYNNRISFLVSAVLAQISEFSLILAMAGVAQGSLSADFMTGAVVATLLSMMLTAYVIKFDEQLYTFFKPLLAPFEHLFGLRGKDHHHAHEAAKPEVVIIGVNSMSAETVELLAHNKSLLVIEKNPKKLHSYQERGIHTICSDVFNTDLYDELIDFTSVKSVASVMGDFSANAFLIRKLRSVNKKAALIVTARTEDQGRKLYKQGATLVLVPDVTGRRILADALSGDAHIHDVGQAYEQELNKSFVYFRA